MTSAHETSYIRLQVVCFLLRSSCTGYRLCGQLFVTNSRPDPMPLERQTPYNSPKSATHVFKLCRHILQLHPHGLTRLMELTAVICIRYSEPISACTSRMAVCIRQCSYKMLSMSSNVFPLVSGRKRYAHTVARSIHDAKKYHVP